MDKPLHFDSIETMVKSIKPTMPMHCWHLQDSKAIIESFLNDFPGKTFYAVKANSDPTLLQYLYDCGIRAFDVASLYEVKLVRDMFPDVQLAFMNPIKNRHAIKESYTSCGVRVYSLDTLEELKKILDETDNANDLTLFVRLSVPKGISAYDISGSKFGAAKNTAIQLLQAIKDSGNKVGICFHVGSQMMDPDTYRIAIEKVGEIVKESNVLLDVLDVGGGFPAIYPDAIPPSMSKFFDVITKAILEIDLPDECELWCEPGRSIAAPSQSLVVQVTQRKEDYIYINDGIYGSLAESSIFAKQTYPTQVIRADSTVSSELTAFSLYGPTCDSFDHMPGPFYLSTDIREGDWIVLGTHGAYGTCSQSNFNGFYSDMSVQIIDNSALNHHFNEFQSLLFLRG